MYNTLYTVIRSRKYDLATLIDRIHFYHASGDITTAQMEELIEQARTYAKDTLDIDVKAEILALWDAVHEIQKSIAPVEEPVDPGDEPEPDIIPEYVQPTGAHDAYNEGDKVSFNGKVYRCIMNNCVWNPEIYPAGWEEV